MTTEASIGSHCDTNDNSYNGWKNRETWALNLWYTNDRGLYAEMMEFIKGLQDDGVEKSTATVRLSEWFQRQVDQEFNRIKSPLIKEMFSHRVNFDVDYTAVAIANLEDYGEVE